MYHFGESYAEFACKEEFEEGESVGLKPKRKNQNKKQPKTKSRGLEFTYGSTSELWILFCVCGDSCVCVRISVVTLSRIGIFWCGYYLAYSGRICICTLNLIFDLPRVDDQHPRAFQS